MPVDSEIPRKGAWLVSVVGSVVIFAASMAFLVDAGRTFFAPPATPVVAEERPVRVADVASVPAEDVVRPAPAITNGPPLSTKPATSAVAVPGPIVAPSTTRAAPSSTVVGATATATTGVNVRAQARGGSAKVGTLEQGKSVAVLETQGAWTHISTETLEGWVFSKYLSAE
jgi:uncharacterized protein YgiM (DUF1202 family)